MKAKGDEIISRSYQELVRTRKKDSHIVGNSILQFWNVVGTFLNFGGTQLKSILQFWNVVGTFLYFGILDRDSV